MNLQTLIAECTAYDFKLMLEERKPKSWLKSVSAFANGTLIQDQDIANVSSVRRNPVLADVMAQLDYMEKRGSGLRRICRETKALEGYQDNLRPQFNSTPAQFQTTIYALDEATQDVGDNVGTNVGRNVGDQSHGGT